MNITIDYEDALSIYDIETEINSVIVKKQNICFSEVQNNILNINISL